MTVLVIIYTVDACVRLYACEYSHVQQCLANTCVCVRVCICVRPAQLSVTCFVFTHQFAMKMTGVVCESTKYMKHNKCSACPSGSTCDGTKATVCATTKYVKDNKCLACPKGSICDGTKISLGMIICSAFSYHCEQSRTVAHVSSFSNASMHAHVREYVCVCTRICSCIGCLCVFVSLCMYACHVLCPCLRFTILVLFLLFMFRIAFAFGGPISIVCMYKGEPHTPGYSCVCAGSRRTLRSWMDQR